MSWGLAVLATLYWELCRATEPYKMPTGGCLLLLQSWAWWKLPFLRLRVNDLYMFPLVTRHGDLSGGHALVQSFPQAVSAIGGGEE
ncbi:hypothetical protein Gohar_024924 [Gossypium harknessii]|uniref:Aminotransferase-like plant mobile domain-containing protein n=1 Tax=Gossypium harknessii TaxID=34285 RepID=A0A7J9HIL3_9ROSI|nr:hypothetical protein [Gossypium harknessii]